jgi:hypothetical protein
MHQLLTEPIAIQDVFASGLAQAEDLQDGNFRFTFYARQKSLHDYSGTIEYVVVARIVLPTVAVFSAMQMTKDSIRQGSSEVMKLLAH